MLLYGLLVCCPPGRCAGNRCLYLIFLHTRHSRGITFKTRIVAKRGRSLRSCPGLGIIPGYYLVDVVQTNIHFLLLYAAPISIRWIVCGS